MIYEFHNKIYTIMKHILSINELYKSTYISAANKIIGDQGSRKSRLKKHADLKVLTNLSIESSTIDLPLIR